MPTKVIEAGLQGAAPKTYVLSQSQRLRPTAAFAHFDGAGALTAFIPVLTFKAPNGAILSRVFPSSSVAAGGVADVSYAPFPGGLIAGGITRITSNGGSVVITAPTGPETNLEINFASSADNGYCAIGDKKTVGTDGGTFTSGAWQTRDLNTEVSDVSGLVTISGNRILLQPGTYRCFITAPGYAVDGHQIRLQDVTHGTTLFNGTVEIAPGASSQSRSVLVGEFTLANLVYLEIQHRCATTQATTGFGKAASFGDEWYTLATFWATNITYANQTVFDASGTFTVPVGVTSLDVSVWGAGGRGDSQQAGGGGGAYARKFTIPVTAGNSYAVTVGVGGGAGVHVAGGTSSFTGNGGATVSAVGGTSGDGTGGRGFGGAAASGVGDLKFSGGDGGTFGTGHGAGGGGSGGDLGDGQVGANGSIPVAAGGAGGTPNGGAGGNGGGFRGSPFYYQEAEAGHAPGGGGGAKDPFTTINGAGSSGRVTIGWNDPPP